MLKIKNCIVIMDTLNAQKEIAHEIRKHGMDYVFALKENNSNLYAEVRHHRRSRWLDERCRLKDG